MFHDIQQIERVVFKKIGCDKINYLALMMVDPFVHYHVLPRFKELKIYNNIEFLDPGYPSIADLNYKTFLDELDFTYLVKYLKGLFVD